MNIFEKLNSGAAYFVYSIGVFSVTVLLILSAGVFTKYQFVYQIVATLMVTIATAVVTMALLKRQSKTNFEIIEAKGEEDLKRELIREHFIIRSQNAHDYLNELFSVIEDGKLTKREAMQLEFKLQHILLNSVFHICDIDDDGNEIGAIHMKTIDEISTITKRILSSVVQNDMSHIHGDMMDLSISLYKTFGVEEFVLDEEEYKVSVVQNFFDIYKMAEASEKLNGKA
ncbi:MAG: hypothetical protein E7073_06040 [Bacteroidales bacterium]|nr:hypothetical protein [Bacteroidales bacterium]